MLVVGPVEVMFVALKPRLWMLLVEQCASRKWLIVGFLSLVQTVLSGVIVIFKVLSLGVRKDARLVSVILLALNEGLRVLLIARRLVWVALAVMNLSATPRMIVRSW